MRRVTPHSFAAPTPKVSPFVSYHITEYSSPAYVRAIKAIERIHQEQDVQKYNKKIVNAFDALGFPAGTIIELIEDFKSKGIKTVKQQLEIAKEMSALFEDTPLNKELVKLKQKVKRKQIKNKQE